MRFLADVAIPRLVIERLRACGHEVRRAIELGLDMSADADILQRARDDDRVVLTHDLDFGALLAASGDEAPSVIILRLRDAAPEAQYRRLDEALTKLEHALGAGIVLVVRPSDERMRRLPIRKG